MYLNCLLLTDCVFLANYGEFKSEELSKPLGSCKENCELLRWVEICIIFDTQGKPCLKDPIELQLFGDGKICIMLDVLKDKQFLDTFNVAIYF